MRCWCPPRWPRPCSPAAADPTRASPRGRAGHPAPRAVDGLDGGRGVRRGRVPAPHRLGRQDLPPRRQPRQHRPAAPARRGRQHLGRAVPAPGSPRWATSASGWCGSTRCRRPASTRSSPPTTRRTETRRSTSSRAPTCPTRATSSPGARLYDAEIDEAFAHELARHLRRRARRPDPRGGAGPGRRHLRHRRVAVARRVDHRRRVGPGRASCGPTGSTRTRRTARGTTSSPPTTRAPTERWIATPHGRPRRAARPSAARSAPLAMANWPTADPLRPPRGAARETEDLVGVDAMHVLPTDAWPGGTFASFHAYPYYPDFQRYEPGLQDEHVERPRRPVRRLRRRRCATTSPRHDAAAGHRVRRPVLAGQRPLRRRWAATRAATPSRRRWRMDADMMRMLEAKGAGGRVRLHPGRTSGSSGPGTPSSTRTRSAASSGTTRSPTSSGSAWSPPTRTRSRTRPPRSSPAAGAFEYVYVWADASWVHVDVTCTTASRTGCGSRPTWCPGPQRADYRVDVDLAGADARAARRTPRPRPDPAGHPGAALPPGPGRPLAPLPADHQPGVHHRGQGLPGGVPGRRRPGRGHLGPRGRRLRLDRRPGRSTRSGGPSGCGSRGRCWAWPTPPPGPALGEGIPAERVTIDGIDLRSSTPTASTDELAFTWPEWNYTTYQQRPKAGLDVLEQAYRDLAP